MGATNKLNTLDEPFPQNFEICEISRQQNHEKISQYKGVYWHKNKWYVLISVQGRGKKYGGTFKHELDAGKRVNQLCKEFGIPLQNPSIGAMPNQKYQKNKNRSQYNGVYYHTQSGNWCALIYPKGQKKYGGIFKDELDAAKRVSQLCEELKIPSLNPGINGIPNRQYQRNEKTSQYKGVSQRTDNGKWYVRFHAKGHPPKYGGQFDDEINAAKRVNQLCQEMGIPPQNPSLSAMTCQPSLKKIALSQYYGVTWSKKNGKWLAQRREKGQTKYYGSFNVELDAAKKVNQLCEKSGIPPKNPSILKIPIQQSPKKEIGQKLSQYKGVYWNKKRKSWYGLIQMQGKQKFVGTFTDELAAAHRVQQVCEEFGLINILDENKDPDIPSIKENLVSAINNEEETIITEINLRTQNGESAVSIAAKHGFSNAVKFLISKGADKEHFTNEHHTPLSLAVSHNHLNVVRVLFENWMSPNVHEKPYLHLSPIFNVKSREIAQLLIDNDAVTHDIYNDKHQSPLTVACQNGYLDVVEFFLDDGLDINHLDSDNKTSLFYALANKHHDIANLLNSKAAQN